MPYALKSPKGKIHWETISYWKDAAWDEALAYAKICKASEENGWKSVRVKVEEIKPKKKGK